MKREDADIAKNSDEKPVRENKPHSIADDKSETEKDGYPFKNNKEKQENNQEEYIDPAGNTSKQDKQLWTV